MIQTYHTTEEITAIVRAVLPAGDTLREALQTVRPFPPVVNG